MTVDPIQKESIEKAKNYIVKKARLKKRKITKRDYTICLILLLMFTSISILFFL